MTEIDVPDWVVEVAAKAIYDTSSGSTWEHLEEVYRDVHRDEASAAIKVAMGAWMVPVGVRYRVAPNDACKVRPWVGPGIVAEWNRPPLTDSETLQYQPLYTLRQEKPE